MSYSESLATCVVSWPSAPLTLSLVKQSLQALNIPIIITSSVPPIDENSFLIQWSSYDQIDHNLTHSHRQNVLSSSYIFRKALIRKHFLSQCIRLYVTKHPTSSLTRATPRTFEFELSFSDELDELWVDDLWELGAELVNSSSWWILKPSVTFGSGLLPVSLVCLVEWPIAEWVSGFSIAKIPSNTYLMTLKMQMTLHLTLIKQVLQW